MAATDETLNFRQIVGVQGLRRNTRDRTDGQIGTQVVVPALLQALTDEDGSREQGAEGLNLDEDSNPTQIDAQCTKIHQGNQTQFHPLLDRAPSALLPLG